MRRRLDVFIGLSDDSRVNRPLQKSFPEHGRSISRVLDFWMARSHFQAMDQSKSKLRSSAWEIRPILSLVYILLLSAFWCCPIAARIPSRQRGIPVTRVRLPPQNRLRLWQFRAKCFRIAYLLSPKAPRLQRVEFRHRPLSNRSEERAVR